MDKQVEFFMKEALFEARSAGQIDEVPIGAVVVKNGRIIGRGHNLREHLQEVTMHAEIIAITEACQYLHSWRLEDCDLYVTLEPCMMCSGAILNARIKNLYYGAPDPKAGAVDSLYHLLGDYRLNHQVDVHAGICATESSQLLRTFFRRVRHQRKAARRRWRRQNPKLTGQTGESSV